MSELNIFVIISNSHDWNICSIKYSIVFECFCYRNKLEHSNLELDWSIPYILTVAFI